MVNQDAEEVVVLRHCEVETDLRKPLRMRGCDRSVDDSRKYTRIDEVREAAYPARMCSFSLDLLTHTKDGVVGSIHQEPVYIFLLPLAEVIRVGVRMVRPTQAKDNEFLVAKIVPSVRAYSIA